MPLKCGAHLKNPSPSPPSAKLSIKFLIMFSVLPSSDGPSAQPASLLSSFHVEIRPLKQRRVPFSTPQAARGEGGGQRPRSLCWFGFICPIRQSGPSVLSSYCPIAPPSDNLLLYKFVRALVHLTSTTLHLKLQFDIWRGEIQISYWYGNLWWCLSLSLWLKLWWLWS